MLSWVKRASWVLMLAVAGCANVPSAPVQAASSDAPAYTLGSGDKLHIIVYNETELTGDYAIAPDGTVAFPLIGNVPASGRSGAGPAGLPVFSGRPKPWAVLAAIALPPRSQNRSQRAPRRYATGSSSSHG